MDFIFSGIRPYLVFGSGGAILYFCTVCFQLSEKKTFFILGLFALLICIVIPYIYKEITYQSLHGNTYRFDKFFPYNGMRIFFPASAPIILGGFTAFLVRYKSNSFVVKYALDLFFILSVLILLLTDVYIFLLPENILVGLMTCLIIFYVFFNQESMLVEFLEFPVLRFIGKISYEIYVWQGLFLLSGPGGKLLIQQFPVNIILVLLISIISYFFYEKKFMKLKERFA